MNFRHSYQCNLRQCLKHSAFLLDIMKSSCSKWLFISLYKAHKYMISSVYVLYLDSTVLIYAQENYFGRRSGRWNDLFSRLGNWKWKLWILKLFTLIVSVSLNPIYDINKFTGMFFYKTHELGSFTSCKSIQDFFLSKQYWFKSLFFVSCEMSCS